MVHSRFKLAPPPRVAASIVASASLLALTLTAPAVAAPARLAAVAGPASTAARAAAATRHCSGAYGGGFFHGITARGVTCATARGVTRIWVKRSGFGSASFPRHGGNFRVRRFSCRLHAPGAGSETGTIACTASDGDRVRFIGHP